MEVASPPLSRRADWVLGVEDNEARLVLFASTKAQNRHNEGISVYLPSASVPPYHQTNALCYQKYAARAVEDWAQRPFAYAL